jgi:hypothetical protein
MNYTIVCQLNFDGFVKRPVLRSCLEFKAFMTFYTDGLTNRLKGTKCSHKKREGAAVDFIIRSLKKAVDQMISAPAQRLGK